MRKLRPRERSISLKVTEPGCDHDKDQQAAFSHNGGPGQDHAATLHSGSLSGLQWMTYNLQREDCGEASSQVEESWRAHHDQECFPVSHCLTQSSMEAKGQERLSSNKHRVPASLARPGARANMGSKKDPAFLELTIWEAAGGEISNHADDKRWVIQRLSKGNI